MDQNINGLKQQMLTAKNKQTERSTEFKQGSSARNIEKGSMTQVAFKMEI